MTVSRTAMSPVPRTSERERERECVRVAYVRCKCELVKVWIRFQSAVLRIFPSRVRVRRFRILPSRVRVRRKGRDKEAGSVGVDLSKTMRHPSWRSAPVASSWDAQNRVYLQPVNAKPVWF